MPTHCEATADSGRPGFYSKHLDPNEVADLLAYADDLTLDDEIALIRVALRRILAAVTDADPARAQIACDCARTIARLLKDKKILSGETGDAIAGSIEQMLTAAGELMGIDLLTPIA